MNEWPSEAGEERAPHDREEPFHVLNPPPEGGPVLSRTVCICNKRGLHARAAAKFVKLAEQFSACVTVRKNGNAVSARSICNGTRRRSRTSRNPPSATHGAHSPHSRSPQHRRQRATIAASPCPMRRKRSHDARSSTTRRASSITT